MLEIMRINSINVDKILVNYIEYRVISSTVRAEISIPYKPANSRQKRCRYSLALARSCLTEISDFESSAIASSSRQKWINFVVEMISVKQETA